MVSMTGYCLYYVLHFLDCSCTTSKQKPLKKEFLTLKTRAKFRGTQITVERNKTGSAYNQIIMATQTF